MEISIARIFLTIIPPGVDHKYYQFFGKIHTHMSFNENGQHNGDNFVGDKILNLIVKIWPGIPEPLAKIIVSAIIAILSGIFLGFVVIKLSQSMSANGTDARFAQFVGTVLMSVLMGVWQRCGWGLNKWWLLIGISLFTFTVTSISYDNIRETIAANIQLCSTKYPDCNVPEKESLNYPGSYAIIWLLIDVCINFLRLMFTM
ncbi:hypothetical protein [Anabaena sp. UHCC 0253]|uniref:hypothetical protein n=1 Tax=Anabaena sp. UHCC 0253 TaxID=2590019 RepID=UPI001447EEA5|nr:hypothetical protein [Anabaena sp. UHCC 0253]